MKQVRTVLLSMALVLALVTLAFAQAKEETLKGNITCGKCELKVDKTCATVIVVDQGGKKTTYYFDPAAHKKYHKDVCQGGKNGTVTGTVETKNDKKIVKVANLKYD